MKQGFTLIETSIMLIIIGLIVGGILAGKSLKDTAKISAQISQIQKYQTAVATFQNKYGGLPGNLMEPNATNAGFQPRGGWLGVRKTINSPLLTHNIANSLSVIRTDIPFFSDAYPCPNSQLTRKPA